MKIVSAGLAGGDLKVRLDQGAKVCFVRPSVDVLFNIIADCAKGTIVSIVLTGMGRDGTDGAKKLNKLNHHLFIQDKYSSVVWGMAGSVDKEKIGAKMVRLSDIGPMIDAMTLGNI